MAVSTGLLKLMLNPTIILCVSASLLSACSDSGESASDAQANLANPINSAVLVPDGATNTSGTQNTQTDTSTTDTTQSGNVEASSELSTRLETSFIVEGQQIVPTSGWICDDVFEQKRTLYFYPEGVLDADRKVLVERILIADNQFNDVSFFYSVSGTDSLLITSTIVGEQGNLLSSGQQHDINTFRFTEVDSIASFTANSVLRGSLVCALFDLN